MSSSCVRASTILFSLAVVTASGIGGFGAVAAASADAETQEVALEVTLVNQANDPIGGAELNASWDTGSTTRTTASNGKAFVSVPEGADVRILIDHPNYIRNSPYMVANASERDVTIQMALRGEATVVVEDGDGRVGNAAVRLYQDGGLVADARTDDDGRYTSPQIERGEYSLVTFKDGYLRNRTTLRVNGQVRQGMRIEQSSVLVTFNVEDDHFDPPRAVPNANVTIEDQIDVTTQGTGSVTVSVPVNDRYDVEVTKTGFESVTRELEVRESQTSLNATVRRTPALSAETLNEQVVVNESTQLTVTDEYGDPVANATVTRDGEDIGETDANGALRIPVTSVGDHTITASEDGLETSASITGVRPAGERTDAPTVTPTATATPPDEPTATPTSSGGGPGFGAGAALAAFLAAALVAARRR